MDIPTCINLVRQRHNGAKARHKQVPLPSPADGFRVQTRGRLVLITPDRRPRWDDQTRLFRSLVCDRDGTVVSAGLPKFMSPGRDVNTWSWLAEADADAELRSRVRLLEKLDGSLIIRSVHRSRVMWRTRGSFDLGSFTHRVEKWVAQHAPQLADPNFAPQLSMLFEWQDSATRVIVHHARPMLTLLSAQTNAGLVELSREETLDLADESGIEAVGEVSYEGALEDLPAWVDESFAPGGAYGSREGVVVIVEDDDGRPIARVRVKSEWYRLEHAMRFECNVHAVARAFERTQRRNVKGKAKKRREGEDPVVRVCDELKVSHPQLVEHVARVCDELAKVEQEIEREWERLVSLRAMAADDPGAGRRLGLDSVASAALRGMSGKTSRAKSRLVESRRAQALDRLAR